MHYPKKLVNKEKKMSFWWEIKKKNLLELSCWNTYSFSTVNVYSDIVPRQASLPRGLPNDSHSLWETTSLDLELSEPSNYNGEINQISVKCQHLFFLSIISGIIVEISNLNHNDS